MQQSCVKVSVIMAAYNAERTIKAAIESVLSQTYRDLELIVVDDCSRDATLQVVNSFADPRIRVLRHEQNRGVSSSRHEAVLAAKGQWIAVLDSDDLWTTDKLQRQMLCVERTGAQLVFTASSFMTDDGTPLQWILHVPEVIGYRRLLKQNIISNSSVMVLRELYLRYETLDDTMHEDFTCWLRLLKAGHKAVGIDVPLLCYRLSANAKTSNKWKAMRMNWRTYRAVGLSRAESLYYTCWYVMKGLRKYSNLKI